MSAHADVSKFIEGLKRAGAKKLAAAVKAVDIFGEQVIGDAQEITPRRTGTLIGSGTAEPKAKLEGNRITKQIGFNTEYAAAVHERLDAHHDRGQAKFLWAAMQSDHKKLMPFVKKRMDQVTE